MIKVMEKPGERLNAFPYNHPIYQAVRNYLDRLDDAAPVTAVATFANKDVDPLASMSKRSRAADVVSKASHSNARLSPYIIVLVLLAFVPAQALLLTPSSRIDEEKALEEALVLVKKGASQVGDLFSIPAAEAAIAPASTPPVEDRGWSDVAVGFKLLLAEQAASETKRAENDRVLRQLEVWMFARTRKSAKLVGACTVSSLGCWKTATVVR